MATSAQAIALRWPIILIPPPQAVVVNSLRKNETEYQNVYEFSLTRNLQCVVELCTSGSLIKGTVYQKTLLLVFAHKELRKALHLCAEVGDKKWFSLIETLGHDLGGV